MKPFDPNGTRRPTSEWAAAHLNESERLFDRLTLQKKILALADANSHDAIARLLSVLGRDPE